MDAYFPRHPPPHPPRAMPLPRRSALPSSALSSLVLAASLAACASRPDARSAAGTPARPDTARIAHVLGGLRPTVELVGRAPVRWTIAERMARYNVPGVSIAVIEGNRVAWARGVGVKQAGTADSVTPATLFQAA